MIRIFIGYDRGHWPKVADTREATVCAMLCLLVSISRATLILFVIRYQLFLIRVDFELLFAAERKLLSFGHMKGAIRRGFGCRPHFPLVFFLFAFCR